MEIKHPFKTPVLLIAFNRPEYTIKVFEKIRKAAPENYMSQLMAQEMAI